MSNKLNIPKKEVGDLFLNTECNRMVDGIVQSLCIDLPTAPSDSTLSYEEDGAIKYFIIGARARVKGEDGFKMFVLKDITGNTATWEEETSGKEYKLPKASGNELGGIKAEPKSENETVEAKIGEDGKLYVPTPSAPDLRPYATKEDLSRVENKIVPTDDALSDNSTNPVQNKVIKDELDKKAAKSEVSASFVALQDKVNALSGINNMFVGYFPSSNELPAVSQPSWALVGGLNAAKPYAYYAGGSGAGSGTENIPNTVEQGTWSEKTGARLSSTSEYHNTRLRTNEAIELTVGNRYVIKVNSGFDVFLVFFSDYVTNTLDDESNTVGEVLGWQPTQRDFVAEYGHVAIVIKKTDESAITPSDNHGLTIIRHADTSSGWQDLSGSLGTYDFTILPSVMMPTSMAYNYDTEANLIRGSVRLIDNTLYIYKEAAFYIYEQCVNLGNGKTNAYFFVNDGEDIAIDLNKGDTVCIDLQESSIYDESRPDAFNKLAVGSTLKVVSYGNFTASQIPVCQRRAAHTVVNPVFIWMLFYDKIAGAAQNDFAIIGTNGVAFIQNKKLSVQKGTPLFVYRNTGMNGTATYLRLNAVQSDFNFDFTTVESQTTLVIDGKKVKWLVDGTEINDLSEVTKTVPGANYSAVDIPIAHVRSGNIFIYPAFQSVFASVVNESSKEVTAINKAEFLPCYYSVCRAKRNSLAASASWKDRLNLLHISDNHASGEDGYKNIQDAVSLTLLENIGLSAVIDTGDLTNGFGTGVSKDSVIDTLHKVRDILLESRVPVLAQLGNHDANDHGGDPSTALTKEEQWDAIFESFKSRWTSVSFGSDYEPGVVSVSIEQGTWSENAGHRVTATADDRIRSNTAIKVDKGHSYTVSVNEGYNVFLVFLSKFASNELGTPYNEVGEYKSWQQSYTIQPNYDYMAIIVKKADNADITPLDNHGLSVIDNTVASSGITIAKNPHRHYSYYDVNGDDYGDVRIIMLDQLDHDLPTGSGGKLVYTCQNDPVYSQKQIDWLCKVALRVPDGTGIIICNHYPFDFTPTTDATRSLVIDGDYVQGWNMIPDIVKAWQERTTLNKTYQDKVGSQHVTVDVDFSDVGSGCEFITYLCGHTHYKTHKKVEGYDQMMLLEDASGSYGTVYSEVARLAGTPTSNAFSILSIDRVQGVIYRTSYGAYKTVDEPSRGRIEKIPYRTLE